MDDFEEPIAVTAASGKAGRRVADLLERAGVPTRPGDVTGLLDYLFTEVLDGRNESLTHGIQEGLGRSPRSFADYAGRAAATGVWDLR